MGRGRTGIGYMRWGHINVVLEVINFDERILKTETENQKQVWVKRKELVKTMKESPPEYLIAKKQTTGRRPRKEAETSDGQE
jgi:hypothetical protein